MHNPVHIVFIAKRRAYGALPFFLLLTHGVAVGYPVVAPDGAQALPSSTACLKACSTLRAKK